MSTSTQDLLGAGGGVLALIIVAILIVNGILWLFLPFVLISKLNEIIRRLKSIEGEAEATARNTRASGASPGSAARYDSGRA